MLRVFKTRVFVRMMRKSDLTDAALCAAVQEMTRGLIDADLGGGVLKKRVALPGRGKRGSTRTLLASNRGNRWFFLFGYEKNVRADITPTERDALQLLAGDLLGMATAALDSAVEQGELQEICHGIENG
ncbi:type II toxin-antitoxin system RelE/ParE family toxin [Stenotrophomonas sp.]|uniref:type II toxin-antitoxin system RelE/ParE family toxin n=1 Tax=Stenotrophomonas sp. TaxID=69392 RepID=UPI0028AE8C3C|nr:type II toxin-antitoxin system RelE/ParE family toxin [Stenotrophomonas sp.]